MEDPQKPDGRPLIWRVTETDAVGMVSRVTFTYDRLSRLVREERFIPATSTLVYDLEYTYDKLGNRLEKRDPPDGAWKGPSE